MYEKLLYVLINCRGNLPKCALYNLQSILNTPNYKFITFIELGQVKIIGSTKYVCNL